MLIIAQFTFLARLKDLNKGFLYGQRQIFNTTDKQAAALEKLMGRPSIMLLRIMKFGLLSTDGKLVPLKSYQCGN